MLCLFWGWRQSPEALNDYQQLFKIVLAGPASKSLIFQTKVDIALGGSSVKIGDLLQNDQQDKTRPMV